MASDTFKRLLFGLVLGVVFSSLILTVAIDFGEEYNKSASDIGGGSLNLSVFEESIEDIGETSEGYRERFEGGEANFVGVEDATGIFSVASDTVSLITTPFRLIAQVLENILGVPVIVINVILGLLSLAILLAIWSLIKKGD